MGGKRAKPTAKTKSPHQKTIRTPPVLVNSKVVFSKYNPIAIVLFFIALFLFGLSVFKNISYPLFWADESATAVGGQRVLQYGYPKVHDGKNVFYDLPDQQTKIGIDKKTDAYVGGTGWLHYYIAAVAIKMASASNNMYTQTGIMRSVFACIGISGILLFLFLLSRLFTDRFSKFLFAFLFLTLCLFSISLTLLLREVRYYSPDIFLVCLLAGYYVIARFSPVRKKYLYTAIAGVALLLLFNTFAPTYFIMVIALSISETIIIFSEWLKKDKLKPILIQSMPFTLPVIISLAGVIALLPYFRTFEIANKLQVYYAPDAGTFWSDIKIVFSYFWKYELLWLAIIVKTFVLFKSKTLLKSGDPKFKASLFFSLLFIVYCSMITSIPQFLFTRYFSPVIVLLNAIILLDLFCLNQLYPPRTLATLQLKAILSLAVGIIILGAFFFQNYTEISGHVHELSEPYKGPLDYTIPYIKEKSSRTDTLIIATNYEESSYMFYLNSRVIIGYVGNNLKEDTLLTPDIISIRKMWTYKGEPINKLLEKAHYTKITFPIHDNPYNNIPELNVVEGLNHLFETLPNTSEADATDLYIKAKN